MKLNNMTVYEKNRILKESLISRQVYAGLGDDEEIKASDYKRVAVSFSEPSGGQTLNSNDIEFPIAKSNWGNISKIALYDALTNGNKIWEGIPEVVKTIDVASQYKIPRNYLIVRIR